MRWAAERASTRRMDCETGETTRSRPSASGLRKSVGMCRSENEGRSSLQENVEDFLLQRTLKPAHHAHPFVAHPRRPVETPHHRLWRHTPRRKKADLFLFQQDKITKGLYPLNLTVAVRFKTVRHKVTSVPDAVAMSVNSGSKYRDWYADAGSSSPGGYIPMFPDSFP